MPSASAFLNARAHALIGLLLSREVMLRLADTPSAEALNSELLAMGYFRAPETSGHLGFQQRLSWELDSDYRSTLLVLPQEARGIVRAMYRLREVAFLKAAFGCANRQIPQASRPALLGGLHLLNIADEAPLYEASDLRDAVSKTPEPYRAAADNALHQVEEQGSLFPIEIALDLLALHELWLAGRELRGLDKARITPMFGVWFDMFNVLSAARLRLNYVASSDEALGFLIHHGLHLRLSHRRALAGVEKLADLAIVLRDTPYPGRFKDPDSLRAIENGMMEAFRDSVNASLSGYPFHLGSTVAYLLLKQIEITNLTRVHDAKRRGAQNIHWAELLV